MKNLFKITVFVFATTFSLNAQSLKNIKETISYETYMKPDGEVMKVKTIVTETQPIILNKKDRFKLNQTIIESPVTVAKVILMDTNNDKIYDKELNMSFLKDFNKKMNYKLNSNGASIVTSSDETKLITNEGTYEFDTENTDNLTITVEDVFLPLEK
ncbi:hypothetical protein [uncultured Polaribacter sp.]|uniref:hypothetical protein n=1 Tax=uncultured Polaribacter sp. TaxID=174711 RepID=UPI002636140B|nr:hypothetical protein [uncultured Polaribacter sp.]